MGRGPAARTSKPSADDLGVGPATGAAASEEIEASMLLTLLDPVGGSVGMLPTLELRPRRAAARSPTACSPS